VDSRKTSAPAPLCVYAFSKLWALWHMFNQILPAWHMLNEWHADEAQKETMCFTSTKRKELDKVEINNNQLLRLLKTIRKIYISIL